MNNQKMDSTEIHHFFNLLEERRLMPSEAINLMKKVMVLNQDNTSLKESNQSVITQWIRSLKAEGYWDRTWNKHEWEELFISLLEECGIKVESNLIVTM